MTPALIKGGITQTMSVDATLLANVPDVCRLNRLLNETFMTPFVIMLTMPRPKTPYFNAHLFLGFEIERIEKKDSFEYRNGFLCFRA